MNSTSYILEKYHKIPQNEKTFFQILKNEWKWSLDLIINHKEEIMFDNLFLIIKSYLENDNLFLISMLTVSHNIIDNKSTGIQYLNHIKVQKIRNLNFIDFFFWYNENFILIEQYLFNYENYAIRFVFSKESPDWGKKIYPKYPWNQNLKNLFINEEYQIKVKNLKLLEKINELKKENEDLIEKLNIIKKK